MTDATTTTGFLMNGFKRATAYAWECDLTSHGLIVLWIIQADDNNQLRLMRGINGKKSGTMRGGRRWESRWRLGASTMHLEPAKWRKRAPSICWLNGVVLRRHSHEWHCYSCPISLIDWGSRCASTRHLKKYIAPPPSTCQPSSVFPTADPSNFIDVAFQSPPRHSPPPFHLSSE